MKEYKIPLRLVLLAGSFNVNIEKRLSKIKRKLKKIGEGFKTIQPYIAITGALMLKTSADFETAMIRIQNRLTTTQEVSKLTMGIIEQQVRKVAKTYSSTAVEVANIGEGLAAAGLTPNQIVNALPGLAKLRLATKADTNEIVASMVLLKNTYNVLPKEFATVGNEIIKTVNSSAIGFEDFVETMRNSAPIAKRFLRITRQEYFALIAQLGNLGIKGSRAGTAIKNFNDIREKAAQGNKNVINFLGRKGLGFKKGDLFNAKGEFVSFLKFLDLLSKKHKQGKLKDINLSMLFGKRSLAAASGLLENVSTRTKQLLETINSRFDALTSSAERFNKSMRGSFDLTISAFQEMAIAFSQSGLDESVRGILDSLRGFFNWLGKLDPKTKRLLANLGALAVSIPALATAFGLLAAIVSPISLTIATLAAAALLIQQNWEPMFVWWIDSWNKVAEKIQYVLSLVGLAKKKTGFYREKNPLLVGGGMGKFNLSTGIGADLSSFDRALGGVTGKPKPVVEIRLVGPGARDAEIHKTGSVSIKRTQHGLEMGDLYGDLIR